MYVARANEMACESAWDWKSTCALLGSLFAFQCRPPNRQAVSSKQRRIPMQSDIFNCQQQQASKGERERKRRARTQACVRREKLFAQDCGRYRKLCSVRCRRSLGCQLLLSFCWCASERVLECVWVCVLVGRVQWQHYNGAGNATHYGLLTTGNGQRATDNGQIGKRANGIGQTLSPISEHLTRPRTTVKSVAH